MRSRIRGQPFELPFLAVGLALLAPAVAAFAVAPNWLLFGAVAGLLTVGIALLLWRFRVRVAVGRLGSSSWVAASAIVIPIVCCLGLVAMLYSELQAGQAEVAHTVSIVKAANDLSLSLSQAESAQRGFLLTNNLPYREPFEHAIDNASKSLHQLESLAETDEESRVVPELRAAVEGKIAELRDTLTLADQGRGDEAVRLVRSDSGFELMQRATSILTSLRNTDAAVLVVRRAALASEVHKGLLLTSISAVFAFLGAGASLWLADRESRRRQESDQATRESEARYRTLADNTTDLIVLRKMAEGTLYVSPASRPLLGYTSDELAAADFRDLLHPADLEDFLAVRKSVGGDNPRADSVYRIRRKDGVYIWVEIRRRWIAAGDGQPARILSVVRDVTERKEAEDAAARLQALLTDALEAMRDSVTVYDSEGRLTFSNTAGQGRREEERNIYKLGLTYEEIVRGFWHGVSPETHGGNIEDFIAHSVERHRRGDGFPLETKTPSGDWYIIRHFRLRDGGTLTVSTDITDLKKSSAELADARDAAFAANRAKSAFLASMSHEIRTPMNGVIGFADILLDSPLAPEQREYAQHILNAGRSLLAIINDILDISKIEAGKLELESVPTSPQAAIDGAVSILKSQIVAKGLELKVDCRPDVPMWLLCDPTRLRQILVNLVGNALKFTARGHITIECRVEMARAGRRLRFAVSDTGIGIPVDKQHLLFQDFSQIDPSMARRYGGTGLGLSICRRFAEAMGGEIGVTSKEGVGSTFWFTIALTETAAPQPPKPTLAVSRNAVSARILLAEDLPMNQLIVKALLMGAGHRVTVVDDGAAAVAAVQHADFDLVLMDTEMPQMDGLTAARAIRALDGPARDIPIVALTANVMPENAAECRRAGMNDFLSKPVDRGELDAAVARWSGRRSESDSASQPPRPQTSSIFDDSVLKDLSRILGAPQAAQIADLFRSRIQEMIPIFVRADDRAALAREAHNLISMAGNVGCTELTQVARDFSVALKQDPQNLGALARTVVFTADRALAALDRYIAA